jgi:hypothetical protein
VTSDVLCRARRLLVIRAHPSGLCRSGLCPLGLRLAGFTQPTCAARQARFRAPSRQRRLPPRTRTPSLDECSLHPAVTRCSLTNCSANAQPARAGSRQEPATVLAALPPRAGFRRSFAPRSGEGGEARPAAVRRNGPSAARRLLQPKHSASTTARSPEPRFCTSGRLRFTDPPGGRDRRCKPSSSSASSSRPLPRWNRTSSTPETPSPDLLLRVVLLLAERLQPRFHGPGTRGLSPARRPPPRLLATEASPRPDPLEHLVSRARRDAGRSSRRRGHMRSEARVSITNPPDEPACAWLAERPACAGRPPVKHSARACFAQHERLRIHASARSAPLARVASCVTSPRAASRDLPRRRSRSAAPEVPSIVELPIRRRAFRLASIRGRAALHRLSPICGVLAGASAFFAESRCS